LSVFSFEHKPIARFEPTQFIYADAWREFDRLESRRERNAASWMRILVEVFLFAVIPLGGIVLSRRHVEMIAAAWAFLILIESAYRLRLRSQFVNWQCPRCHTKWPGTRTEKDSSCKTCALRLHQLTS
jgi:hypothetical protein